MAISNNTKVTIGLVLAVGLPAIMLAANLGQARAMNATFREQAIAYTSQVTEQKRQIDKQNEVLVGIREEIAKLSIVTAGTQDALLEVRAELKHADGVDSDLRVEISTMRAELRALENRLERIERQ